jgi:predicted phosphodiesterase
MVFLFQTSGPRFLANSARNTSLIKIDPTQQAAWKFAVIGDLGKRYEIFLRALSEMKRNDVRFVVITGDSVYRKTAEQYEYLQRKVTQSRFDRPILAAIGNEDMVARGDYALFRRYLAHGNAARDGLTGFFPFGKGYTERFAFTVPAEPPFQAMFVVWDNAFGAPSEDQTAWIEKLLEHYRRSVRYVFLFSHQPIVKAPRKIQTVPSAKYLMPHERLEDPKAGQGGPKIIYELIRIVPGSQSIPILEFPSNLDAPTESELADPFQQHYRRFYAVLKEYRITAVFSGHLHGYRRYQIGDTLHFVTGGGGARLQYPGSRHHYLEVEVRNDGVTVRPRILDSEIGAVSTMEQVMISEVFLYFRNNVWLYGVALVWISAGVWLLIFYRKGGAPT